MKSVLIVSGHTNLENDSMANKAIINTLQQLIPTAKTDLLDSLYPNFKIDVKAEQDKLTAADIVVLQFPVFWYHMPSLLERWMECTFERGFSHGSTGDKLKGKKLVLSFTTGAAAGYYHRNAEAGVEIEEIIIPAVKTMCRLTQMDFAGYVFTGGVSYTNRREQNSSILEKSQEHARRVAQLIENL